MTYKDVLAKEDFKKCLEFHGHLCPGVAIGYRAAKVGLEWLRENRSEDEELVAIVETDACGADAIQVLTGCTFGKGNFIYQDYGKNAFSFISRGSGSGVRVALRAEAYRPNERLIELFQKIRTETATEEERAEFVNLRENRSHDILEQDQKDLFTVESVDMALPPRAKVEASEICDQCGEPTMASKLQQEGSSRLCRSCLGTSL